MRKRTKLWNAWRGGLLAIACGLAMAANSASAQPVIENAYVDTEKNTQLWVWVDDSIVGSEFGINYDSLAIDSQPSNGSVSYNSTYALMTYMPDEDYEGYDGFTFTIEDELGNPSALAYVFVYVEPEGTITNLAPVIVGFHVEMLEGNYFAFNGYVLDDQDTYGRVVEFGDAFEGQTVTVGYGGQFSFLVYIPPNDWGNLSARYLDPFNVYSEDALECFSNQY